MQTISGHTTIMRNPQVAFDAAGNAIAAWTQCTNFVEDVGDQGCTVWANRYAAGSGWGTAQLISDGTHEAAIADLAVDAAGNAIALYHQEGDMLASRYVPGSGWGAAQLVAKAEDAGMGPDIAFDAAGNAIAVWNRGYAIVANRYVAGSGWGTATFASARYACEPYIAVDAAGNAIAVWIVDSGLDNSYHPLSLWASRYMAGSGWGVAQKISEDKDVNIGHIPPWPRVGIDASGNAIAVWMQYDELDDWSWSIISNRYVAGSGWGAPQRIFHTYQTEGAWDAHLAVAPAGNAIAIWLRCDSGDNRLRMSAARFE
ncbi:MAG: hypothetical protein ACTFAL_04470 [Candidatus Electronema sp. V4]|uniref:hypothetical protein n=1 Tax=Candidatus Electronema sp. V4 TaxID=3454756 RepID=UPI0040554576